MRNQWLIIVAVGEKGVHYGTNHPYPRPLMELIHSANGNRWPWTLTRQGGVMYFLQSRSTFKLIEQFTERAKALRETLPLVRVGLAREILNRRFDWFGLTKQEIENNYALENRALGRAQGPQSYRQTLEYMEAESGFVPMLEVWR
jgi:hypothetical protein